MNQLCAHCLGLLDLSQQYMEWDLKRKLENLIRAELTTDNAAYFYGVATKFKAKVVYKHNVACKNKTGSFLLV